MSKATLVFPTIVTRVRPVSPVLQKSADVAMLRWLQPIEHLEAMNDQLRSVGYPDGPTKFAHNSQLQLSSTNGSELEFVGYS